MSVIALFTWIATILAGLVLFIIWIIEYDAEFQTAAATRLPVPVISLHALLGLGGLMLWIWLATRPAELKPEWRKA